jgi:outer membrane protein TolC
MQVNLAVDNIKLNVKQISSCSESVKQADKAHDIMVKSFAIGAASYLDLRDSELSLTQAKLSYYQAIFNYLVARSELELLLGNAPIDSYKVSSLE